MSNRNFKTAQVHNNQTAVRHLYNVVRMSVEFNGSAVGEERMDGQTNEQQDGCTNVGRQMADQIDKQLRNEAIRFELQGTNPIWQTDSVKKNF